MAIIEEESLLHWNYFIALESDIEKLSRYIEFSEANFNTYSLELSHLLISISSEIDVIAKMLLKHTNPSASKMKDYRIGLCDKFPNIFNEEVVLGRFALKLKPWTNFEMGKAPDWWNSYNGVKHRRNEDFHKGNLKNVLNSMSALFILNLYLYEHKRRIEPCTNIFNPPSSIAQVCPTVGGRMAVFFKD